VTSIHSPFPFSSAIPLPPVSDGRKHQAELALFVDFAAVLSQSGFAYEFTFKSNKYYSASVSLSLDTGKKLQELSG